MQTGHAGRLKTLLDGEGCLVMPCCFDALSARMIEKAGFSLTFMSGFAVSATRLGAPDRGLISYGEMLDQGRSICEAVDLPVIGDADTGYGNPMNVRRTVEGYARAGFASVMIEDQLAPKRCGHTRGKEVVSRQEAALRIRAAVDARESGADVLIMARTDARAAHGLDEAMERCRVFADLGADILFLEAPKDEAEMETFCRAMPGLPKMANIVEDGETPALPPARLGEIGFRIAAYPLSLLSVAARAMQQALADLAAGRPVDGRVSFEELQALVGFPEYEAALSRYED
jgi:2-methylisocitrate lyase-like PEP mutase family enzyme